MVTSTEIVIYVNDDNDNSPEFQTHEYQVTLLEDVRPNTQILPVLATDQDIGNNGEVSYSLSPESQHLAHLFRVDTNSGWVTSLTTLDYETDQSFTLTILASDNGQEKHTAETRVRIQLVDVNDNPPEFSQRLYSAAVNEGALPGTIIFQLHTSDHDTSLLNPVNYFITEGDTLGQFLVKENGELYVARALDREQLDQYRLEVLVTDGSFVSRCRVNIEILDENDSPPLCSQHLYRKSVAENILPGSSILTVTATDADEGQNAKQIFSLGGDTKELFSIDPQTGVLTNVLMLDRESQDSHFLTVEVKVNDI